MTLRRILAAAGAGITAFLLVTVAVIEVVRVDPGAGILGVLAGAVAGALVVLGALYAVDGDDCPRIWAVEAAAAFGYVVVGLQALSYVNAPGVRTTLTVPLVVAVAAVAACVVLAGEWYRHRSSHREPAG